MGIDEVLAVLMGDSGKYPYPTTGDMNILPPPPPLPSEIPKLITLPSRISVFFRPFGILG